jgi:RNase P subunit RPR2
MFTDVILSAKQSVRKASLTDAVVWWRCTNCAKIKLYDPKEHMGPHEDIHDGTFVDTLFREIKYRHMNPIDAARLMCRGCMASLMCRHAVLGFINRLRNIDNITGPHINILTILLRLRYAITQKLHAKW